MAGLAVLLVVGLTTPAGATEGGFSLVVAPPVCSTATITGQGGGQRHSKMFVPAGATVQWRVRGFSWGGGLGGYADGVSHLDVRRSDGSYVATDAVLPGYPVNSQEGSRSYASVWTTVATNSGASDQFSFSEWFWKFVGSANQTSQFRVVGGSGTDPGGCSTSVGSVFTADMLGARAVAGFAADPVNTGTGNLVKQVTDFASPAGVYGLAWGRTYNSLDDLVADPATPGAPPGMLGPKWTTSFDVALSPWNRDTTGSGFEFPGYNSSLELRMPDGRRVELPSNPLPNPSLPPSDTNVPSWQVPAELFASVSWDHANRQFKLQYTTGELWTFDDWGRIVKMTSATKQSVLVCRSGNSIVTSVRANVATCSDTTPLLLSFTDINGDMLIDKATASDGTVIDYGYSGGVLSTVSPRYAPASPPAPLALTEAGTGTAGFLGDGGPATAARLNGPQSVAYDRDGNLLIADTANHRVRKVARDGTVSTLMGTGTAGASWGPATQARLNNPIGVARDTAGNLYITDYSNVRIRKVDTTGKISVIAGNGMQGFSGDGGPATQARISYPMGLTVDGSGNVYFADRYNHRVRKISSAGVITTVAGNGANGNSGDGGPATDAALGEPTDVKVDGSGNLFITDYLTSSIRKVTAAGTISTIAGTGTGGFSGDGGPATSAQLSVPYGLTLDGSGNVIFADQGNNRVRKITTSTGVISTIAGTGTGGSAGDGGQATSAQLNWPTGVVVSGSNIFISENAGHRVRKIASTGVISTVAGTGVLGHSGDGGPGTAAQMESPQMITADASGNVWIAEGGPNGRNSAIRKLATTGTITTVAGTAVAGNGSLATGVQLNAPAGVTGYSDGRVFVSDTGNHRIIEITTDGYASVFAGTGTAGAGSDGTWQPEFAFNSPTGIAAMPSGDILVADTGTHRVLRLVGNVQVLAGNGTAGFGGDGGDPRGTLLNTPTGLAVDQSTSTIYVADTGNNRIRKFGIWANAATVTGTGTASFSGDGGAATAATVNQPRGVTAANGELYIADTANHRIRKITSTGTISTVMGTGTSGFNGDNDTASTRRVASPRGVTVDAIGQVRIADTSNHRIRTMSSAVERYRLVSGTPGAIARIEHSLGGGKAPVPEVINTFDALGRVLTQDLPDGDHVAFVYKDQAGDASRTTEVTWCSGWTGSACGGTSETTKYRHDAQGRLIGITDANTGVLARGFDRDLLNTSTDRVGAQTGVEYDLQGRVVSEAAPDPGSGFVPPRSGDSNGCNRTAVGGMSYYQFPVSGTGGCTTANGKAGYSVTTYTYCTPETGAADPRVVMKTDPLGNVMTYWYGTGASDANPCPTTFAQQATPTKVMDPIQKAANTGTVIVTAHDGSGNDLGLVTTSTDADGIVTTANWDTTKRLKSAEGIGGRWTYYGYDAAGRRVVVRTPLGEETWTAYDATGRATDVVGPVKVASRSCTTGVSCVFPTARDVDGPTTHTDYWLDDSIKTVKQQVNFAATGEVRQTDYDTSYLNGTTACTPPAATCQRVETVTEPPHAYNPAGSTTRTVTATRYNSAGTATTVTVSDTANVNTALTTPAPALLNLGRQASTSSASGVTTTYGYDGNVTATGNGPAAGNGDLTSTKTGPELTTKTYDKRGRVTEERGVAVTDETGTSVQACAHYTSDALDRVTQTDIGAGAGALGAGCAAVGSTKLLRTRTLFDSAGRTRYAVVDADGDNTWTTPAPGCVGSSADPEDVVSETTYSKAGRVEKNRQAPQDLTSFNWCSGTGHRETVTDYYANTDTIAGHIPGQRKTVTPPAAANQYPTQYSYDDDGRTNQVDLMNGGSAWSSTLTAYDAAGRPWKTTTPSPTGTGTVDSITCYNAFGDTTYESDPGTGRGAVTCGSNGWASDAVNTGGYRQFRTYDYNQDGSQKTAWSALRWSLANTLPAAPANCFSGTAGSNACQAATGTFYDGRGNRTTRVSWTKNSASDTAHRVTEKWTYNNDDQVLSYTDPIQTAAATPKPTTYAYYANTDTGAGQYAGKLKTVTQPTGRNVTATYRSDGQLAKQEYRSTVGGAVDVTNEFWYDAAGRRTKYSDTIAATTRTRAFTYDTLGRMIADQGTFYTSGAVNGITWTYDLAGTVREMTYPDQAHFQFTHDSLGRMTAACGYVSATCVPLANYTWTNFGPLASETNLENSASNQRSWTYGLANHAAVATAFNETVAGNPTAVTVATTLTYLADGRQATETNGATTHNFAYDHAGELCVQTTTANPTCATSTNIVNSYTYNTRGMRLATKNPAGATTNYAYDDNARILTATPTSGSGTAYSWDDDGRRTIADTGTGANKVTTTYDARGLPSTLVTTSGATTTNTETRGYDAAGRLTHSVYDGNITQDFLWEANSTGIPQILDAQITVGASPSTLAFRTNHGIGRVSFNYTNSGTPQTPAPFAYDAHGSTIGNGYFTAPASYDPYGNPQGTYTNPTSTYTIAPASGFGYHGETTINGLIHLRARDYDPNTGTFTTPDPLDGVDGVPTTSNPFHYTDNDPLNNMDPTGMRPDKYAFLASYMMGACPEESHPGNPSIGTSSVCGDAFVGECATTPQIPTAGELRHDPWNLSESEARQERDAEVANCAQLSVEGGVDRGNESVSNGLQAFTCSWRVYRGDLSGAACNSAHHWAGDASRSAVEGFRDGSVTRLQNARRHFIWSFLIGYEVGVDETANVTSIHEEYGLACTGTPRECDWDQEADAHNNSIGARSGSSGMGRFGTRRGCDDPNAVPEVGCSASWHRNSLLRMAKWMAVTAETFGALDTRGGCPSSYAYVRQGC